MTRVRQNPQVSAEKPTGQLCPAHGTFDVPPEAARAQRDAVAPGVPVEKARGLLAYAARLRRACPQCPGSAPDMLAWAIDVRDRHHLTTPSAYRFKLPPIEEIDPEAASW